MIHDLPSFRYTSAGADAHPASPSAAVPPGSAGASGMLAVPRKVMENQHEYCKYVLCPLFDINIAHCISMVHKGHRMEYVLLS